MVEDYRLSKVDILFEQKKYAEAERILQDLLAEDVNNIHYLSLLAETHLQQDKAASAREIIDNAIGLSPAVPHLYYIKSRIAVFKEQYDEAESCVEQAITLDPYDADYFAWLAKIKLVRKQYEQALAYADKALEIDAENLLGLNTRSTALLKLNRKAESFTTIEGALRENPNNPYTHANYGWGLLEKGDHKKALTHFQEALQSNPTYEYAQAGLLEALKARNPVYRWFLKYAFFIGNLTSKYQWGVIIGFYIGQRVLRSIADSNEALQPYLTPLVVLLALVAFSTWVITPISNLFLRFNKYGQLLLDKAEKKSSNFVAVSFAVFVIGAILYFATTEDKYLALAVFGFAMMVPFSVMFSEAKYKYSLLIYSAVLGLIGVGAVAITFSNGILFNLLSVLFIFGFIAFQFVSNYLTIKQDNI
ncbi:tetratricopeptide repeat protein [Pontibacter sp. H249]|uniref:tetratricopeptide repeat protein n=1 Tax=Pontibacter sp. H249 TaxID=3133420 RepID=UPI0030BB9B40